jgi:hypothetical protein
MRTPRQQYDRLSREEVDSRIRKHAGDNVKAIIAWVRSALLSDEEARELLYLLDTTPPPERRPPSL